jgi:hypothetical protein
MIWSSFVVFLRWYAKSYYGFVLKISFHFIITIITFLGSQLNRFQSIALQAVFGVCPTGPMAPHLFVCLCFSYVRIYYWTTLYWWRIHGLERNSFGTIANGWNCFSTQSDGKHYVRWILSDIFSDIQLRNMSKLVSTEQILSQTLFDERSFLSINNKQHRNFFLK